MNMRLIMESFKFHKLKSKNLVKVLFVLVLAIRAAVTMLPIGDREFKFLANYLNGNFNGDLQVLLPSKGNWIIIGLYILGIFLSFCIILLYAEVFILENESSRKTKIRLGNDDLFVFPLKKTMQGQMMNPESIIGYIISTFSPSTFKRNVYQSDSKFACFRAAFIDLLRKLPQILLFSLFALMAASISSAFIFFPFIIFILMFLFTPMNFMYAHNKFFRSMKLSMDQTNGAKFSIFLIYIMQNFIFSILNNLLGLILADYHYSFFIIEAFIYAFRILSIARMYGLLYQMLALRQPYNISQTI